MITASAAFEGGWRARLIGLARHLHLDEAQLPRRGPLWIPVTMRPRDYFALLDTIMSASTWSELAAVRHRLAGMDVRPFDRRVLERSVRNRESTLDLGAAVLRRGQLTASTSARLQGTNGERDAPWNA